MRMTGFGLPSALQGGTTAGQAQTPQLPPSTPGDIAAAQAWLDELSSSYETAYTALQSIAATALKDSPGWNTDAAAAGNVAAEQDQSSLAGQMAASTLKSAQSDLLTAVEVAGVLDEAAAKVTDPTSGMASLNIASQASVIANLLNELAQARALIAQLQSKGVVSSTGAVTVPAGTVKTSTAVVSAIGGVAAGAILGGLAGHAVGAGLLAGEMAAEGRRRRRGKR